MNRVRILSYVADAPPRPKVDSVASEEPLEIRVDSRPIAVVMRTPGHDEELAVGFLVSEGLVRRLSDIRVVKPNTRNRAGNSVDVLLAPDVKVDFQQLTRHVFASSSCGLCGATSIRSLRRQFPRLTDPPPIRADQLLRLPSKLQSAQDEFSCTGGLHAAAWFQPDQGILTVREDIGRHNAVDKLLGRALLNRMIPLSTYGLLVSGRVSFEIVQKALAGGIALIAALSAPSSLAVQFARANQQTLVGFLRDGRFNVYAGHLAPGGPIKAGDQPDET
ncbi:MAG TPA: formate dehydrogenase accessory sulfurtransferase FdhD [Verrucomicrobiota bacterium]|nr:formate dehydrogenase accessory sulfurtransferase FdhD [Verrucomicrobiales bacterium]HRI11742.1 formate dehydrogenase accessory sulfurtransferase FdhD [Verrucomicrobiota bacterium]